MSNRFPQFASAASVILLSCSAHAQTDPAGLHLIATGGLTYSGDSWTVASSANGAPVRIRAGGKVELGGGLLWQSDKFPVAASATLNVHYDNSAGGTSKATLRRFPLEALVYYTGLETLRFGAGLRYLHAPSARVDVDGRRQTVDYKNVAGGMVEIGYALLPGTWLNLRLASEKYKPANAGSTALADVTHVGLNLSHRF